MIPTKRQFLKNLAKIFDICVLACSFAISSIVFSLPKGVTPVGLLSLRITLANCLVFTMLLIVWHNLFTLCGLYVSKRMTSRKAEAIEIGKATMLASILLIGSARLFQIEMVTASFTLLFWLCTASGMIFGRLAVHSLLLALRLRGKNRRFLIIVGTNERAIEFARQITERPELGYKIVGFVDDDWEGIREFEATGYKRCCSFAGLAEFLRTNVVDEAAMYLPLRSYYEHSAHLVSQCEQHGIVIRFDQHAFNSRSSSTREREVDHNSQIIDVPGSREAWPATAKRIIDFGLSAVLLIPLAPVLLIVAALIKFMSPGPVFFHQTRVGLNKRQFTIYKFRTMLANAEQVQAQLLSMNEMTGPVFKIEKDPRITPLGRILRKTSIDELPQLWNVLKGDMSLVGPRAMSMRDYLLFDQDWQRRRFSVKPGITCLWQVNGRSSIPFEQWMELDIQYIDKWSLWLDLKILAQTVPAVLRGTGAA